MRRYREFGAAATRDRDNSVADNALTCCRIDLQTARYEIPNALGDHLLNVQLLPSFNGKYASLLAAIWKFQIN